MALVSELVFLKINLDNTLPGWMCSRIKAMSVFFIWGFGSKFFPLSRRYCTSGKPDFLTVYDIL
jgi:hypothetical protein